MWVGDGTWLPRCGQRACVTKDEAAGETPFDPAAGTLLGPAGATKPFAFSSPVLICVQLMRLVAYRGRELSC